MKKGHWAGLYVAGVLTVVCLYGPRFIFASSQSGPPDSLLLPDEQKHLKNVRQLTFGGQNAEAYFSIDDKQLIFQHQGADVPCDQIYTIEVDTPDGKPPVPKLVSTGKGRTTCSYFFPSGDRILFSSTHATSADCPSKPDYSHGYVWPIYSSYQIYTATPDGSDLKQLTHAAGYNAEATITRDGKHIVFTSTRNGDLDIYTMDADGGNVKQLTNELGYDGGPFWSYDGTENRLSRRTSQNSRADQGLQGFVCAGLIRPGNLEIWVMNADGSDKHQVTHNGAANFAPYWLPDGTHHLRFQSSRSEEWPRLRSLRDQRRRKRPGTHHVSPRLRRISHVHFRRQASRVGFQSQRKSASRNKYLHCRLGGIDSQEEHQA